VGYGVDIAEEAAMYFERWGLLAHRLEKRDLKDMCLCFPTWVLYLNGAWCATWAYRRSGVQETGTYHTLTLQKVFTLYKNCVQDVLGKAACGGYDCGGYAFCLI